MNYNDWRRNNNLPPLGIPAVTKPHTFKLSDAAWKGLQQRAIQTGYNNVTQYLEAMGQGLLP